MKNYYRIMLGAKSAFAEECYKGGFIGANFRIDTDLTRQLPDSWREFNKKFIPIWLEKHPGKSKISAGLSCGFLYTIAKGILKGDIVLCPNGSGGYYIGEVIENYSYQPGTNLPHQRKVRWYQHIIDKEEMSEPLQNSAGSIGTVSNISKYAEEIERLISGHAPATLISTDESVEAPSEFALEKYLEDFLVQNWQHTELGKKYDIYEENGELAGQQFQTDTGYIDILAISKDKKELLVVELKKGKVSDMAIGQLQRYMGFVQEELAEKNQIVKGIIIALEDDLRIKRALAVTKNIEFYRYQVNFKLFKN